MKPVPHQEIRGGADRVAVMPNNRGSVDIAAYITGEDGLIYRVQMALTPEAAATPTSATTPPLPTPSPPPTSTGWPA